MPLLDSTNPTTGVDTGQAINSAIQVGMAGQQRNAGGGVQQANQLAQSQLGLQAQGQNFQQKMAIDQALQQKKNDAFQQTITQQQLAMQQQQQEFATSMGVQQSVFQQMSQRTGERWQTFQQDMQDLVELRDKAKMENRLEEAEALNTQISGIQQQSDGVASQMNKQSLFSAVFNGGGAKLLQRYKDTITPLLEQQKNSRTSINARVQEGLRTATSTTLGAPAPMAPEVQQKLAELLGRDPSMVKMAASPQETMLQRTLTNLAPSLKGSDTLGAPVVSNLLSVVFLGNKESQQAAHKALNAAGVSDDDIADIHDAIRLHGNTTISTLGGDANVAKSKIPEQLAQELRQVSDADLSFLRKSNLTALDKDLAEVSRHIHDNLPQLVSMGLVDDREGVRSTLQGLLRQYEQSTGRDIPAAMEGEFLNSMEAGLSSETQGLRDEGLTPDDMDGAFKRKQQYNLPEGEVGPQIDILTSRKVNLADKKRDLDRSVDEARRASGARVMKKEFALDEDTNTKKRGLLGKVRAENIQDRAAAEEFLPSRKPRK